MNQKIIDISPCISSKLAVWPGDVPVTREVAYDMKRGDVVSLSALRATVHLGSHADAPSHYGVDGRTMEQQPLELYWGKCEVIKVNPRATGGVTSNLPGAEIRFGRGDLAVTYGDRLLRHFVPRNDVFIRHIFFTSPMTFCQSAAKRLMPVSVSGCLAICSSTA